MRTRRRVQEKQSSDDEIDYDDVPETRKKSTRATRSSTKSTEIQTRRSPRLSKTEENPHTPSIKLESDISTESEHPKKEAESVIMAQNGIILPKYETNLVHDYFRRWSNGKSIFIDEQTVVTRFPVLSILIDTIQQHTQNESPVLIISSDAFIERWISELANWAPSQRVVVAGKTDDIAFEPLNFSVVIMKKDRFTRHYNEIEDVNFSLIIVDDFTGAKSALSAISPLVAQTTRTQTIVITTNFPGMPLPDLASAQQMIRRSGTRNDNATAESLRNSLKQFISHITVSDVVDSRFYNEVYVECPMTQTQQKAYIDLFDRNREKLEEGELNFLCDFATQAREISTHPLLADSENPVDSPTQTSGKMIVLLKLLNSQKMDEKRVAVVCNCLKTVSLIHSCLQEHQIPHSRFENSTRQKQAKRLVTQFNETNTFTVLLLHRTAMDTVLPIIDADTMILFDSMWSPSMNPTGILEWQSKSHDYPYTIYHLVTKNSFEALVFEYFWNTGELPFDLEDIERANENDLKEIVKLAAKLAYQDSDAVRGSSWAAGVLKEAPIINFCDDEQFPDRGMEIKDNFWAEVAPVPVKPVSTKSIKTSQFWDVDRVSEYISAFRDFGFGRWADIAAVFGRAKNEVIRIGTTLMKMIDPGNEDYRNINIIIKEINAQEPRKLELVIQKAMEAVLSELDQEELRHEIEMTAILNSHIDANTESPDSVSLDGVTLGPMNDDWTPDDDKKLLFSAWRDGLCQVDPEYKARLFALLDEIGAFARDFAKSTIIRLKPSRKFNAGDHTKILNHLMNCGRPSNMRWFKEGLDIQNHSSEAISRYVSNVIGFCTAPAEEKKTYSPHLADKIPKYTAAKIPQRLELFQQVREAAANYEEYAAEDLEFLTAVASHGLMSSENSPVLTCSCYGSCSEAKLFKHTKSILTEPRQPFISQKVPPNIINCMPLRINDMLIITNLGVIDTREGFHTREYIYPVGYTCCCVCPSPTMLQTLIWMEGTITERDKKPWFVLHQLANEDEFEYSGSTPDEAYAIARKKIMETSGVFIPPLDGHEMFGLTSAMFHKVVLEMPGIEGCLEYQHRRFRSTMRFSSTWPTIGQFEREPENVPVMQTAKFRYKKKLFGDMLPPLVLDMKGLFTHRNTPLCVDVITPDHDSAVMLENYEGWMK